MQSADMISIIVLRRNKNSNYVSFLFQIRNGYNVKEVLHAVQIVCEKIPHFENVGVAFFSGALTYDPISLPPHH